ncbi:MAG: hypothetical protein JOZ99_11950 [Actinobacteria bacterium]|nr:hypothetical protein [Actinomycetota bacterium]
MPDAVKDFGAIPVMPVLCGRCGRVLDEMSVDTQRGWVFYRPAGRSGRVPSRRPRIARRSGRRPWSTAGGQLPGDRMRYTCEGACRRTYEHEYEELRIAVLRAVAAGRSRVVLGQDL